ncbi:MAG: radical SAM additional 4Fe4S-binding domain protein [Dehalococcoidia bacterium]|nr:radical SAM additional 4Fe4S-binding domain protein [Dehalococcoidia bacterium]MBF8304160.1 radical additional 4Fe4S-binding domain protein [Dehalococcoidia bacterium]
MPEHSKGVAVPSRVRYSNTGKGPLLQPIDIGHDVYVGLINPDTAFWSLVKKDKLSEAIGDSELLAQYRQKAAVFAQEMKTLRFGLKPSAVYFNPTERCNLNCDYCYIPGEMRKDGAHMSKANLMEALSILKVHFKKALPEGSVPQVVFHGSEPMLNREAMFAGIEQYQDDFHFGVQTNGTLLDNAAIDFLTSHRVGIGLSLDGHIAEIADKTRHNWSGEGVFLRVTAALERLKGYANYNVICTVTNRNVRSLRQIVDFFHSNDVPACMLNPVRCTQEGARKVKPGDAQLAKHYMAALDRSYELYQKTGRKLVIANFANVIVGIVAPTARRLMCDISPCGGGRCFFALSAKGDIFPCSEFIGLPHFRGGNIFTGDIGKALTSDAFSAVTGRKVENIEPCSHCAIRHFCGAPCPAESSEMNGCLDSVGAFCELYEEQVRYAFRLIADGKEKDFLWDGWDAGAATTFDVSTL